MTRASSDSKAALPAHTSSTSCTTSPKDDQLPLLERLRDLLAPRGVLVVKDITTEPRLGLEFTRILDRVMVGWEEPLAYRHHREWGEMLTSIGFHVRMVRVPDVLPYPHVVIAATKVV